MRDFIVSPNIALANHGNMIEHIRIVLNIVNDNSSVVGLFLTDRCFQVLFIEGLAGVAREE